jgi:hypothetical protein
VLACAVGGAGAASLAALAGWAGLALFGLAVALPQWLVLRQYVPGAWLWVPLTALGVLGAGFVALNAAYFAFFGIGFLLLTMQMWLLGLDAPPGLEPPLIWLALWGSAVPIGGASAGAVVGAVQLVVLQRLELAATRWVVASLLGGALVSYPAVFVWQVMPVQNNLAWASVPPSVLGMVLGSILAMALGGAAYGLVTGAVLARLVSDLDRAR